MRLLVKQINQNNYNSKYWVMLITDFNNLIHDFHFILASDSEDKYNN